MSTVTVRVNTETRDSLRELARREGASMRDVLARAVEQYRQEQMIAETNAAYRALRDDLEASRAFDAELEGWDATLADGLGAFQPAESSDD